MNLICKENGEQVGREAARLVAEAIRNKPDSAVAFPTGSSPIPCFRELAAMYERREVDFSGIRGFNMDEYIPLPPEHPQSCSYFLKQYLYGKVNMDPAHIFAPDATDPDLEQVCRSYTEQISRLGGLDLMILGIGRDGHITFNMPGDTAQVDTYVTTLSRKTVEDNSRFFGPGETVPTQALTLGMGIILQCRKIILVADGPAKAEAIGRLFCHKAVTTDLPASFLWLHKDVTVIVDRAAAAEITMKAM